MQSRRKHRGRATRDGQRAVAAMAAGSHRDVAACADKREIYVSALLDLNLLLALLRLCRFRQSNREHTVLETRINLIGVDAVWHLEGSLEGTEAALG
jgi:hypothetical protein